MGGIRGEGLISLRQVIQGYHWQVERLKLRSLSETMSVWLSSPLAALCTLCFPVHVSLWMNHVASCSWPQACRSNWIALDLSIHLSIPKPRKSRLFSELLPNYFRVLWRRRKLAAACLQWGICNTRAPFGNYGDVHESQAMQKIVIRRANLKYDYTWDVIHDVYIPEDSWSHTYIQTQTHTHTHTCTYKNMYIYIYMNIEREREMNK